MLTAWRPFFNRYYCTHRSVLTLRDVSLAASHLVFALYRRKLFDPLASLDVSGR